MNDKKEKPQDKIIELKAWSNLIREHLFYINLPYSIILSAIIFPPVAMLIFSSEYSPLSEWYKKHSAGKIKEGMQSIQEALKDPSEFFKAYKQAIEVTKEGVMEIGKEMGVNSKNPHDILNFMEDYCKDQRYSAYEISEMQKTVSDFKEFLLNQLALLDIKFKIIYKNLNMSQLFGKYIACENTSELMGLGKKMLVEKLYELNFMSFMVIPNMISLMLGQRFITDKLLQKLYTLPTIPKEINTLNSEGINELLKEFKEKEKELVLPAQRNKMIAMMLLPIVLVFCMTQQNKKISSYAWYLLMTLFSTAMTGIVKEGWSWRKRGQYEAEMTRKKAIWETLFKPKSKAFSGTVSKYEYGNAANRTLERSGFMIEFLSKISKLGNPKIAKYISYVFQKHAISFESRFKNQVSINATISLSGQKIEAIKKDIEEALSTAVQSNQNKLKVCQVLSKKNISYVVKPFLRDEIFLEFKFYYLGKKCTITGDEVGDNKKIKELEELPIQKKDSHSNSMDFQEENPVYKKVKKEKQEIDNKNPSEKFVQKNTPVIFNKKEKGAIYGSFFKNPIYVRLDVDKKTVGDEKAYKIFQGLFEDPHFVKAKGQQGFKFRTDGTLVAKLMGTKFGSFRLVGHKEKKDNKTTYIFNKMERK